MGGNGGYLLYDRHMRVLKKASGNMEKTGRRKCVKRTEVGQALQDVIKYRKNDGGILMKNKLSVLLGILLVLALVFGIVMLTQKNGLNTDLSKVKATLTETEGKLADITKMKEETEGKLADLTKTQEETATALEGAKTELTELKTLQETTAKTLADTTAVLEGTKTELKEAKSLQETTGWSLEETARALEEAKAEAADVKTLQETTAKSLEEMKKLKEEAETKLANAEKDLKKANEEIAKLKDELETLKPKE